ncbi:MAG: energy transducer TonB, partial [Bacteroidota bacterium]
GISGTVYVYFVINKEGKVSNAEVRRGVKGGPGLDKEALRVIQNMPAWSIGKQNGRPASVQFTLPVKFVLK